VGHLERGSLACGGENMFGQLKEDWKIVKKHLPSVIAVVVATAMALLSIVGSILMVIECFRHGWLQ